MKLIKNVGISLFIAIVSYGIYFLFFRIPFIANLDLGYLWLPVYSIFALVLLITTSILTFIALKKLNYDDAKLVAILTAIFQFLTPFFINIVSLLLMR